MNPINPDTYGSTSPWQRYINREHAARDAYLATVTAAHREYLTGPWPDRDAYNACEQSAWVTYYAAGRQAWQEYKAELAFAAPLSVAPSAPRTPYADTMTPWPVSPYDYPQPTFTQKAADD